MCWWRSWLWTKTTSLRRRPFSEIWVRIRSTCWKSSFGLRKSSASKSRGELFPQSIYRTDPEWVQDGKLTDKGFTELRARLPYADLGRFQDRRLSATSDLFTVDLVTAYVGWKLGRGAGSGTTVGSPGGRLGPCDSRRHGECEGSVHQGDHIEY